MERKAFLDQEPPPGYIPGIGRGATGFTTQADLGSSRKVEFQVNQDNNAVENEDGRFDDSKLDSSVGLLTDEKEADQIYDDVERYLERKRKKHKKETSKSNETDGDGDGDGDRDKKENKDDLIVKNEKITETLNEISQQFQDAKRELSTMTVEQWENLPESGDFTRKNKRHREELQQQQRFYRNSDMVTLDLKDSGTTDFVLDNANDEIITNDNNDTNKPDDDLDNEENEDNNIDLIELSKAKDRLLETHIKLGLSKKKSNDDIDKLKYLKQLEPNTKNGYNIGDYKKTRKLFTKMRENNPYKPQNWIASARLELEAKKINKAKELIQEGCEKCLKNEEIWLVNLDINSNDLKSCKSIVADAIRYNYKSIKLWKKAIEFEQDKLSKIRILRKALEILPKNVDLWLELLNFEDNLETCQKIVIKAIEIIPNSIDLWFKYCDYLNYKDSIAMLSNECVDKIDESDKYLVYIKISEIEEKNTANEIKIYKYIKMAIDNNQNGLNFNDWIVKATDIEEAGYKICSRSIILESLHRLENEEKLVNSSILSGGNLIEKALEQKNLKHLAVAEAILTYVTEVEADNIQGWKELILLKKSLDDWESLIITYETCVSKLTNNVDMIIEYIETVIKYTRLQNEEGKIDKLKVREIIAKALEDNPTNERMWIFGIDFETKLGNLLIGEDLVAKAIDFFKDDFNCITFWDKRVQISSELMESDKILEIAQNVVNLFSTNPRSYVIQGNVIINESDKESKWNDVIKCYNEGIRKCFDDRRDTKIQNETEYSYYGSKLYISLAQIYDERCKDNGIRARAVLEEGLSHFSKNEELYHHRIILEQKHKQTQHLERLLAKGLKELPHSAILWCDKLALSPRNQIKNVYGQALKASNEDKSVVLAIACDLWKSGKVEKANQFFKLCLQKDKLYGDVYIYYYAYLLKYGDVTEIEEVEEKLGNLLREQGSCVNETELIHGRVWDRVMVGHEADTVAEQLQVVRDTALAATGAGRVSVV